MHITTPSAVCSGLGSLQGRGGRPVRRVEAHMGQLDAGAVFRRAECKGIFPLDEEARIPYVQTVRAKDAPKERSGGSGEADLSIGGGHGCTQSMISPLVRIVDRIDVVPRHRNLEFISFSSRVVVVDCWNAHQLRSAGNAKTMDGELVGQIRYSVLTNHLSVEKSRIMKL